MGNDENANEEVVDQQSENANPGQNDNGSQNDKSDTDSKNGKTFTQEQVNKMMAREKQQGSSSVYKKLGIDQNDTAMITAIKAFVDAQKTKEQKEAEAKTETDNKISEAEQRAATAEAKVTALGLGVKADCVDDVVALAIVKVSDDKDLSSVIKELKKSYPFMFTDEGSSDDVGKRGTGSSVGGRKSSDGGSNNYKGIGKRLAASKKGSGSNKSSFWD